MIASGLLIASGSLLLGVQERAHETKTQKPAASRISHHEDEQAIRRAFAAYVDAINKGDVDAVVALWAPEGDYVDASGQSTSGREAIGALCKPAFPHLKGSKATGRIVSMRFISPDVALAEGVLDYTDADGTRESNRFSTIWAKADGGWLLSCARDLPGESEESMSVGNSQLKQLEWLLGEWEGQGNRRGVHAACRWAPNQSFLLIDYTVKPEGEEPKLVTLRIGWDPLDGVIRSWVFDSLGGFGEGTWERDGKRWLVNSSGVLPDGDIGQSTDVWESVDDKTYVWHSVNREVDGTPVADVEVKFARQAAK
jgi:uncharacterized protein (TIGR02246 family)